MNVEFIPPSSLGAIDPIDADKFADGIFAFSRKSDVQIVLLDGPQAWKDPNSELLHCRQCEKLLGTPVKTGITGCVKPTTARLYVDISIAVFDRLTELGGELASSTVIEPGKDALLILESFPTSAWRKIGILPLPARKSCEPKDIEERVNYLRGAYHLKIPRIPSHDETQALVAGLAGLAILNRDESRYQFDGSPPIKEDGHWLEGYIANPRSDAGAPVANLQPFEKFADDIRSALQLGGCRLSLARAIYALAKEKISQDTAKWTTKYDTRQIRAQINSYDKAWRAVEIARKEIFGLSITSEAPALDALAKQIKKISDDLEYQKMSLIDRIHPALQKKNEKGLGWKSLLIAYEPSHIRSRAVEHWFFAEMDSLLTDNHVQPSSVRHRIIQATMKAAFNDAWQVDAIKAALHRSHAVSQSQ